VKNTWLDLITQWGEANQHRFEYLCGRFDRHHVVGRKAKYNKEPIGLYYVLPIAKKYHDVHSNNPYNVTHYPKKFELKFGTQQELFFNMCCEIKNLPFEKEIFDQILNYHKHQVRRNIDFNTLPFFNQEKYNKIKFK
tara:strand:+ start:120 stop:530 length:411 start_codon:yes stop_codon:yes gene_type:complete